MTVFRQRKPAGLITAMLCAFQGPASACQYNVRDVGFVDWEAVPYRLLVCAASNTPMAEVNLLRHLASTCFLEANVEVHVRRLDQQPDSPAARHLQTHQVRHFPALLLVAPDERSFVVPLPASPSSLPENASRALESVVASPFRETLFSQIVEAFAVVLLIEGTDATANRQARKAADGALTRFATLRDDLPKAVRSPPRVMVLSLPQLPREQVVLWSLGLEEQDPSEPHVAVLYGRGRRIGPVLRGGLITQTEVYRALAILGQDCECDLDRAWMTGPLLPARWGRDLQARVQRQLGFDAENPQVKTEVSRIVARGPSSTARLVGVPGSGWGDAALLGYTEMRIGEPSASANPPPAEPASAGLTKPTRHRVEPPGWRRSTAAPRTEPSARESVAIRPARPTLFALAGIGLAALIGGGWIWWRGRRTD